MFVLYRHGKYHFWDKDTNTFDKNAFDDKMNDFKTWIMLPHSTDGYPYARKMKMGWRAIRLYNKNYALDLSACEMIEYMKTGRLPENNVHAKHQLRHIHETRLAHHIIDTVYEPE